MASPINRGKFAELYVKDSNVDPRTRKRVVPMRILALSMPRTGTMSLQAALEILGYGPTIHGFCQWVHVQDSIMWQEALKAKYFPSSGSKPFGKVEFDQLLGEYEVASDFPSIAFAEELIALYSETKVILVERDVNSWYKSFHSTVITSIFDPVIYVVMSLDNTLLRFHDMSQTWVRGFFGASNKKELEANAKDSYQKHYELVRKITPKERLLDFSFSDGWEPLCAFLGKEVPDEPFPRVNDTEDFQKRVNIMLMIAGGRILRKGLFWLGGTGAIAAALWMYFA